MVLPSSHIAGRYAVESELARGGMGVVYRCRDEHTGRALALKRLLDGERRQAANLRGLFEREYRTLVSLRHPRIIEVYDYGLDAEGPYYTMELLDGQDLRALSPLPARQLAGYLRDVASSLALLHARRLVHRDVSPSNIRLTSEARAKLIDFGALTSFGPCSEIVGTPPGIAPEVLAGAPLDARVDLYALGATAYYALTGRHAYPARGLDQLRALWRKGPPPRPSSLAADVPAELDELILALLSLDPLARPSSAAELIDRFEVLGGLAPERDRRVVQSYLFHPPLVAREEHEERWRARLERALAGHGSALLIEGGAGLGKTALLRELVREASLRGALVLHVEAQVHRHPFGAARALLVGACTALNAEARRCLEPHLPALFPVMGDLLRELGLPEVASAPRDDPGEQRAQAQNALAAFLVALSRLRPLVVSVDDFHLVDSYSAPLYLMLAHEVRQARLLLAAATRDDPDVQQLVAVEALRGVAGRMQLCPLTSAHIEQLLGHIFGDVDHAARLSRSLGERVGGNPGHTLELIQQLVESGEFRYVDGAWVLPTELPPLDLAERLDAALKARLSRLAPDARLLLQRMSPVSRSVSRELCRILTRDHPMLAESAVDRLLIALEAQGLLLGSEERHVFAQSRVREMLYATLSADERADLHTRIAEYELAQGKDPVHAFEAGYHLSQAGDHERAIHYAKVGLDAIARRGDGLADALPHVRRLLELYRARGCSEEELSFLTAGAIPCGYYCDVTVLDDVEPTIDLLARQAALPLAGKLARYVGRPLAFGLSVLWNFFRYLVTPRRYRLLSFQMYYLALFGLCGLVSDTAARKLDARVHRYLLRVLEPARGLARTMAGRLVYDIVAVGPLVTSGRLADTERAVSELAARVCRIWDLRPSEAAQFDALLAAFVGATQLGRADGSALATAQRVDAAGIAIVRPLATCLRYLHALYRGDLEMARREHATLDVQGVQTGSAWRSDLAIATDFFAYHLMADVLGLKRAVSRLEQLLPKFPTLNLHLEVARAMYEGHRGRPREALLAYASLRRELAPHQSAIWTRAWAHEAELLNGLGRHQEAKALCIAALRELSDEDRRFVLVHGQLERELAIAEAALGDSAGAAARLEALLEQQRAQQHPLVLGLLHRDRARVALIAREPSAFAHHLGEMRRHFRGTNNPALIAQYQALGEQGARHGLGAASGELALMKSAVGSADPWEFGAADDIESRARVLLEHVLRRHGAERGGLYALSGGVASPWAEIRVDGLSEGVRERMRQLAHTLLDDHDMTQEFATALLEGGSQHAAVSGDPEDCQLLPLVTVEEGSPVLVGVLALWGATRQGDMSFEQLQRMARALADGIARSEPTTSC